MRTFNYAWLRDHKWDTELLRLIAAIYKAAGKREMFFFSNQLKRKNLLKLRKFIVRKPPTPSKESRQQVPVLDSLYWIKQRPLTVMNKKLSGIAMFYYSLTKIMMPFLLPKIIFFSCIKSYIIT